jgi:hypothetical protein
LKKKRFYIFCLFLIVLLVGNVSALYKDDYTNVIYENNFESGVGSCYDYPTLNGCHLNTSFSNEGSQSFRCEYGSPSGASSGSICGGGGVDWNLTKQSGNNVTCRMDVYTTVSSNAKYIGFNDATPINDDIAKVIFDQGGVHTWRLNAGGISDFTPTITILDKTWTTYYLKIRNNTVSDVETSLRLTTDGPQNFLDGDIDSPITAMQYLMFLQVDGQSPMFIDDIVCFTGDVLNAVVPPTSANILNINDGSSYGYNNGTSIDFVFDTNINNSDCYLKSNYSQNHDYIKYDVSNSNLTLTFDDSSIEQAYGFYVECNNSVSSQSINTSTYNLYVDYLSPAISIDSGFTHLIENDIFTFNVDVSDNNLYSVNISILKGSQVMFNNYSSSLTSNYNMVYDLNISGWGIDTYEIFIEAWDDHHKKSSTHTTKKAKDIITNIDYINKVIKFDKIKLKDLSEYIPLSYDLLEDGDSFYYDFSYIDLPTGIREYKFNVECDNIDYRFYSEYPAHFVCLPLGVDFYTTEEAEYFVSSVNSTVYEVRVLTTGEAQFNSTFGLNYINTTSILAIVEKIISGGVGGGGGGAAADFTDYKDLPESDYCLNYSKAWDTFTKTHSLSDLANTIDSFIRCQISYLSRTSIFIGDN